MDWSWVDFAWWIGFWLVVELCWMLAGAVSDAIKYRRARAEWIRQIRLYEYRRQAKLAQADMDSFARLERLGKITRAEYLALVEHPMDIIIEAHEFENR